MIVSELQFFQVKRGPGRIHAVIFHQTFLSIRPESLDPVDVHYPIRESFTMIDPSVFESIRDETVITSEPVWADQTPSFDVPDGQFQKRISFHIRYNFHGYLSPAFQDPEYRHLPCRYTAPVTFSSSTETGFIHFDLPW